MESTDCRKNKVMVFGTFDRFHKGHEYFLKEARKRGSYLVAVVARDKTVENMKSKAPADSEEKRKGNIEHAGIADKVVLGSEDISAEKMYDVIAKERPDVICLGYDQKFFVGGLEDAVRSFGLKTEITRIKAYKPWKYKTSLLAAVEKHEKRKYH